MRVSLCMIVRNEAASLPQALGSVADLVDQSIVVDTGSTDRTREVARDWGARVYDFPWTDDFAAARNESLRHATAEWIFWLDADEFLDDGNRRALRQLFAELSTERAAYLMTQHSLPGVDRGSVLEVQQARLFRHDPAVRWQYRVHEQILPAVHRMGGTIHATEILIHHTGYRDPTLRRRKLERNLRLLQWENAEHPGDGFILFNLGVTYLELANPRVALPLLRESLTQSPAQAAHVRKVYSQLAQGHHRLGERHAALACCREGLARFAQDAELRFQEALLLGELGDLAAAEARWLQLLASTAPSCLAGRDAGTQSYKARHNLAVLYRRQGQGAKAESQWHRALEEWPDYTPAWLGLGELWIEQGRWEDLNQALGIWQHRPGGPVMASLLRARLLLAQNEASAARALLESATTQFPEAEAVRAMLKLVIQRENDSMTNDQ